MSGFMKLNEGRTWICNSISQAEGEGPITNSTINIVTLIQDISH